MGGGSFQYLSVQVGAPGGLEALSPILGGCTQGMRCGTAVELSSVLCWRLTAGTAGSLGLISCLFLGASESFQQQVVVEENPSCHLPLDSPFLL